MEDLTHVVVLMLAAAVTPAGFETLGAQPEKAARARDDNDARFYTQSYPFVFFRAVEVSDVYPEEDPETLEFLAGFDRLLHDNQIPLPKSWIEHLHTYGGKHRRLIFYQNFPTIRFSGGKDNPRPNDAWKTRFLDDHRGEFFSVNPLLPDQSEYSPGRWAPQEYLGSNEYFRVLDVNLMESISCTWYESTGWKTGVRVSVDGEWYENATPVETKIIPFDETVKRVRPILKQITYASRRDNRKVGTVVVDHVRPRYEPYEDGYRAVTDRTAILYAYAAGKVFGVTTFASDYFDTYAPLTRIPSAPTKTGFPQQGHFKWSRDPIVFE